MQYEGRYKMHIQLPFHEFLQQKGYFQIGSGRHGVAYKKDEFVYKFFFSTHQQEAFRNGLPWDKWNFIYASIYTGKFQHLRASQEKMEGITDFIIMKTPWIQNINIHELNEKIVFSAFGLLMTELKFFGIYISDVHSTENVLYHNHIDESTRTIFALPVDVDLAVTPK